MHYPGVRHEISTFLDVLFSIRLGNENDLHGLMIFPLSRSLVPRFGVTLEVAGTIEGFEGGVAWNSFFEIDLDTLV